MDLRLEDLGRMILEKRGRTGVRSAAKQVGISSATLSRVENGNVPDLETFAKICQWLEVNPAQFFGMQPDQKKPELPVAHFRKKKTVSPETANSLGALILSAQRALEERERLHRR